MITEDDVVVIGGELPAGDGTETVDEAPTKPLSALPARAKLNEDGSVTMTLLYPVEQKTRVVGQTETSVKTYDTLTLHRLRGADLTRMSEVADARKSIVGLARSLRMPEPIFERLWDKMDAADISVAAKVLSYFL